MNALWQKRKEKRLQVHVLSPDARNKLKKSQVNKAWEIEGIFLLGNPDTDWKIQILEIHDKNGTHKIWI